jgi:hypothetical protein
LTESDSARDSETGDGGCGIDRFVGLMVDVIGDADDCGLVNCDASNPPVGDSTCCAVELKYRARLGRRKVGGNADDGIRTSNIDRRAILHSILRVDKLCCTINA